MAREYVCETKGEMGEHFTLRYAVTQHTVRVEGDPAQVYGIRCKLEDGGGRVLADTCEKDVSPDRELVEHMAEHIGREGCFPNQLGYVIRDWMD